MQSFSKKLILPLALALISPCLHAYADTFGTYGNTTILSSGPAGSPVYQLTSNPSLLDYSGIYVEPTNPLALSALTLLSANFEMTSGTIVNGAPRFSIGDTTNNTYNEAYLYFGTPGGGGTFSDPAPGTYESTGNLANLASTAIYVQNNGFGGGSTGASYETWAQFVAQEGSVDIGFITVDVDGGFSNVQTADIGNFDVNGALYNPASSAPATPEPSSLLLLATGALGISGELKRRWKKAATL